MMLRVERRRAGEALQALRREGALDTGRKILKAGGFVDIPVTKQPPPGLGELLETAGEPVERPSAPFELARRRAAIPEALRALLPRKWERYGRVLVLRLPEALMGYRREVAEAYARALRVDSVLLDRMGVSGQLRTPSMEHVWGAGTETVHIENGIRYAFDTARIMFSSGNIAERMRMGRVVERGERVVDMFAGIGYFSLPMAVHGGAGRVWACELNPVAFGYLCRNVRLNRAGGVVEPLFGDCLVVAPEDVADRVVMGHFDAIRYLPKALRVLKKEGGTLHIHALCPKADIPGAVWERVRGGIEREGRAAELLNVVRLKSFKPRVWHIVLDVRAGPRGQ